MALVVRAGGNADYRLLTLDLGGAG
jgi:hypothetical protein